MGRKIFTSRLLTTERTVKAVDKEIVCLEPALVGVL
jgi:hypothetical protein